MNEVVAPGLHQVRIIAQYQVRREICRFAVPPPWCGCVEMEIANKVINMSTSLLIRPLKHHCGALM